MSTVKENSLNVEALQTALMYLRIVVDRFTGDSKLIQIDDLRLEVSNITGLQALLAASQALVTGHENEIPKFNLAGQIVGSGLNVGTFSSDAELAALTEDGTYTFVYTTAFVSLPLCGIVYFVAINNGHRILYTDNGLWHSTYFMAWGDERYIGGAFDNITIPYTSLDNNNAIFMAANSKLSPGASYKITGTGQNLGIILRAASANEFETDGIVLGIIPKHSIGTHSGVIWKGHWADTLLATDVSIDDIFIYYGKCYGSLTGNVGTATNRVLDATNWLLLDPFTATDFYTQVTHGCSYKLVSSMPLVYPTGFIFSRWDSKGNTLSEIVEDADGFTSDMNDWHLDIDGGEFYGNILRRVYNNTINIASRIARCSGNGDIHNTKNCDITDCVLPDETNNIRYAIGSSINKVVLGGNADIEYIADASIIANVTANGDIKGDAANYCNFNVTNCTIGHGAEIKDNTNCTISYSEINGLIDNNDAVVLEYSRMDYGSIIDDNVNIKLFETIVKASGHITLSNCYGFFYQNSVIDSDLTVTAGSMVAARTVCESKGKIAASILFESGTFTIAAGATFLAKTIATGMAATTVYSNAVTVTGQTLVATRAGLHKFDYQMSYGLPTGDDLTTKIFVNNDETAYINTDTYYDSRVCKIALSGYLNLAIGDIVSVRHTHTGSGTKTYTHEFSCLTLSYDN